jgi:hypothetical protein
MWLPTKGEGGRNGTNQEALWFAGFHPGVAALIFIYRWCANDNFFTGSSHRMEAAELRWSSRALVHGIVMHIRETHDPFIMVD